jgi:hypothetical protein
LSVGDRHGPVFVCELSSWRQAFLMSV